MPKSTIEARLSQHDREIAAIRKLVVQGMKMLVANEQQIKALAAAQTRTAAAQERTEKTLDRFIRSLEGKATNGHSKH